MKRRAVKDEQKLERRQAILDVAWGLFQQMGYGEIAMSQVAERAGLAKGTLYLYFKTKEELFLSIQEQQFALWFDDIDVRLALTVHAAPGDDVPEVAAQVCASFEARPGMTRLMAILHTTLEQNIDFETALRFKQMLYARIGRTGGLLEARLSFLAPGEGVQVLMQAYALVIGLQHLADPVPIVRRVLAEARLDGFVIDFAPEFARVLRELLYGFECEKRRTL